MKEQYYIISLFGDDRHFYCVDAKLMWTSEPEDATRFEESYLENTSDWIVEYIFHTVCEAYEKYQPNVKIALLWDLPYWDGQDHEEDDEIDFDALIEKGLIKLIPVDEFGHIIKQKPIQVTPKFKGGWFNESLEKGNKVKIIKTGNIWEGKEGTILSAKDGNVKVAFDLEVEGGSRRVIENFLEENLEMENETEILTENTDLNESLLNEAKEKPEDIIHKYIYLQDLDDKEIPAWNFAARIATAEDMEEGCVCELALDLGYKLFAIEAPAFFRNIIAAKEIKAEDIMEEYGDFLQGKAYIREIK